MLNTKRRMCFIMENMTIQAVTAKLVFPKAQEPQLILQSFAVKPLYAGGLLTISSRGGVSQSQLFSLKLTSMDILIVQQIVKPEAKMV